MSSPMSMFALPGHQVQLMAYFVHCGYAHEKEAAQTHLTVGMIYTVHQTHVYISHSSVELEEVPGVFFNTIYFESLQAQSSQEDQQHPDFIRYFGHLPAEEQASL